MNWRGTERCQGGKVFGSAITLMAGEAIVRVLLVIGAHQAVAGDLGDNRSRGDTEAFTVTTDDSGLRQFETRNAPSIGEDVVRHRRKRLQGAAARRHCSPV